MNALESVEAVNANKHPESKLLKSYPSQIPALALGSPGMKCPALTLTGETFVSDCPEMTDSVVVNIPC